MENSFDLNVCGTSVWFFACRVDEIFGLNHAQDYPDLLEAI